MRTDQHIAEASLHIQNGRVKLARKHIEKALARDNDNEHAHGIAAVIAFLQGKMPAVIEHTRRAKALHDQPVVLATAGRAYLELGDLQNAKIWFDAALTINPHYEEAKAELFMINAALQEGHASMLSGYESHVVFSPTECDRIIETLERLGLETGKVQGASTGYVNAQHYRAMDRRIESNDPAMDWALAKLRDYLQPDFDQPVLITAKGIRYDAGGCFKWHRDSRDDNLLQTLSVQLSDPASYTGGSLRIMDEDAPVTLPREQGSAIKFNPYALHCVDTVATGRRYSLIVWCHISV